MYIYIYIYIHIAENLPNFAENLKKFEPCGARGVCFFQLCILPNLELNIFFTCSLDMTQKSHITNRMKYSQFYILFHQLKILYLQFWRIYPIGGKYLDVSVLHCTAVHRAVGYGITLNCRYYTALQHTKLYGMVLHCTVQF